MKSGNESVSEERERAPGGDARRNRPEAGSTRTQARSTMQPQNSVSLVEQSSRLFNSASRRIAEQHPLTSTHPARPMSPFKKSFFLKKKRKTKRKWEDERGAGRPPQPARGRFHPDA